MPIFATVSAGRKLARGIERQIEVRLQCCSLPLEGCTKEVHSDAAEIVRPSVFQSEEIKEPQMPSLGSRPLPLSPPFQPPPTFMKFLEGIYLVTSGGYLLSAPNGGGHIGDDAIQTQFKYAVGTSNTPPSVIGAFELFNLWTIPTGQFAFQTSGGNFITAVGGGGRTTDVIHTDALGIDAWEAFQIVPTDPNGFSVAIRTKSYNLLTAVDGGGQTSNAIRSDATAARTWETFFIRKWGAPGSGYQYVIVDADTNQAIAARDGGGQTQNTIQFYGSGVPGLSSIDPSWTLFTFLLQSNGSYALQTLNGNYVTAVNSGGLDYGTTNTDNIHTDATVINTWEQFRFIPSDDGTFLIQTFDGHYLGKRTFGGSAEGEYSTDISDPGSAKKFWLVPPIFFEQ